jgi:hypothetical protein
MKPNKCPDCGRTIPKGKSAWECPCLFQTNPNIPPTPIYPQEDSRVYCARKSDNLKSWFRDTPVPN